MKKSILKAALAVAIIAALPSLAKAQWALTGNPNPPITNTSFLGTHGPFPIRFATATGGALGTAQKMIITAAGNVEIGYRGIGTVPPTIPSNKFLVESGNLYDWTIGDGIYDRLKALIPSPIPPIPLIDDADFGFIAYSNRGITDGHNFAITGYTADAAAETNFGVSGVALEGQTNVGLNGAAINGTINNVAVNASVRVDAGVGIVNTNNKGITVSVLAEDNADNIGADIEVTGNTNANSNSGIAIDVSGDNAANNAGIICDVTGTSAGDNIGTQVNVAGATGDNIGGKFTASDGTYTIGVIGEIATPGSNLNYGVYGNHFSSGNNGTDYAGYFNGDVFSTTAYYPSDPKLKENIKEYKGALEQLSKINIKKYTYRTNEFPGMNLPQGEQVGLMANNLKEVFPNLVKNAIYPGSLSGSKDVSFDAVNTNALVPVLVQAVKELDAKNASTNEMKKEIEALKADKVAVNKELEAVKTDNETLKKDMAEMKEMLDKICSNGCGDFKPASTLGGTTGSESGLFQNVPNPFNNSTVIPYTIGQGVKQAVLVITNLNGTELKRFTTSQIGAGTFEVNMDQFGAGTYVYSLFTDGKLIDTKKMVLAGK